MTDSADLLITGGTIVDGTAHPAGRGASSSTGSGCGSSTPTTPSPAHVGRRIDATGKVVAPGFIDLHSHGGLMILAEPRHEPKVRQGVTTEIVGVDGNGFAPFARARGSRGVRRARCGAGRPARRSSTTGDPSASYLARFDGTVSVNIGTLVGNSRAAHRCPRLGRRPGRRPAIDRMRGHAARRDGRGRRRALVRARLPARALRHDRGAGRADRGGRRARRHLSHPRPLSARRPVPRPVPRGDRDRPARPARPPTSPTSITARPTRAGPSRCWRWSTTRGRRASTSRSTRTRRSGPARAC